MRYLEEAIAEEAIAEVERSYLNSVEDPTIDLGKTSVFGAGQAAAPNSR